MKKIITFLFILFTFSTQCFAITVGSPEMTIPEESLYLKNQAIDEELDRHEYNNNLKVSLDIEIITKNKIASINNETSNVELKGQSYMLKFSNNFYNLFEPYIKIGTSNLKIEWDQYGNDIKMETSPGFVWGIGFKAKIYEFENGVKLSLDAQYSDIELDVDKIYLNGTSPAYSNDNFEIDEWQVSLLGSKKLIFPVRENDYYIVPYGGVTYSSMTVDAQFTNSSTSGLFSTFDASADQSFDVVLGLDIMPFFLSYYLLNFELRLMNETAFSLGGTVKF